MRYVAVRGFLKSCGVNLTKLIDVPTHRRLAVKVDGNTDPFTQKQIDALLKVCDDYYRTVFTFLLSTGLRYREASHLTWADVNLEKGLIKVARQQKIHRTYKRGSETIQKAVSHQTKSRKSREVPIFPSLMPALKAWREAHPDTVYVFGTRSDMPDNHWLEYGKALWTKAGLDCGHCDGCSARRSKKHTKCGAWDGGCKEFFLHKFRHSFAHRCLEAGIPIHKVSKYLGHHSISVTAIYLSGGSLESDRDPFAAAA